MVQYHGGGKELPTGGKLSESVGRRSYLKLAGLTVAGSLLASKLAEAAPTGFPYTIVIDGRATTEPTTFAFEVAQGVQAVDTVDNSGDSLSGTLVEGAVDGDVHAYWFQSHIVDLSVEGPATVSFGENANQELPAPTNTFVVTSPTDVQYEFTADGQISKRLDDGRLAAETGNDAVTDNGDGTWSATGRTGNGFGDSYDVDGEVTDFSTASVDFALQWNGQAVTPANLTGSTDNGGTDGGDTGGGGSDGDTTWDQLVITSPTDVQYEFTADGEVRKRLDDGRLAAETGNDSITDNGDGSWTATGRTGNGYGDSYDLGGAITDFTPMTGDYSLQLNGEVVTPSDLTGEEPPTPTPPSENVNGLVGGGDGYTNAVDPSQADYTASSLSELESALDDASSGDVVYLTGDVSTSSTIRVPRGVTLASDRGIDGSPGSTIGTDREIGLLEADGDSRITGLRFDGPMDGYEDWDGYPAGTGIDAEGSGIEIDNCELFGFAYGAISAGGDTHVHHCHIHDNPQAALGYGVSCGGGHPIIEYCQFDGNRHSVASSGSGGYTVRYNHFGSRTIDHVIDVHDPGGTDIQIHHNTVEATDTFGNYQPGPTEAVYIRGRPSEGAVIENNWFFHPDEPSDGGDPDEAVRTPFNSWSDANVTLSNNGYGTSDPGPDIGAPR